MNTSICRWGILGTANIARKNWNSIHLASNADLAAVASRRVERSEQFIAECQRQIPFREAPRAYGSYEALLSDPNIDAVYIPLPTGMRKEWVLKAAEAGKHVLAEKPCGVDADDVRAMIDACSQQGVQFMDGVMFMHSARLPRLRQVLSDEQQIGKIRRVTSAFSFLGDDEFAAHNIRVQTKLEPLGCLGDLGWYNIRFLLWVLEFAMPRQVRGCLLNQAGQGADAVPTEFSAELWFGNDVSASFYCSFITEHQQWAHISGTGGSIWLSDFVLPYYGSEATFTVSRPVFRQDVCRFHMERHEQPFAVPEYSDDDTTAQEVNMIRCFSRLAISGQPDAAWGQVSLKTQQVLDACLASARNQGALVAL